MSATKIVLCLLVFILPHVVAAQGSVEAKINDAAKALSRADYERIAYALQELEANAKIEGSVQVLNRIEDEYPRPLTARDVAILIMAPSQQVRVTVGSDLKAMFSDERVKSLVEKQMAEPLNQKQFADATVAMFKEMNAIGKVEGGMVSDERAENGKALVLVISICCATVLAFLWILLFMNSFVGAKISVAPFMFKMVLAHAMMLVALGAAWLSEMQLGLGIKGMIIIPVVVLLQLAVLIDPFQKLLAAISKG